MLGKPFIQLLNLPSLWTGLTGKWGSLFANKGIPLPIHFFFVFSCQSLQSRPSASGVLLLSLKPLQRTTRAFIEQFVFLLSKQSSLHFLVHLVDGPAQEYCLPVPIQE
jgi:hypothetical protein